MTLARWVRRASSHTELLLYLATAAITAMLTVVSLQLWKANLAVPLNYSGDAVSTSAHFKTVIEEGWYEYQPRLGAPFGQFYNDFPTADNLHLVAAKILGLFTQDWAIALNTYYLVGFVLTAIAAVWFLRTCGVSLALSGVLATVFALAPYHFLRGEAHLWLASYYGIPLGLGLLVLLLRGVSLWGRGTSPNPVLSQLFSPTARTLLWIGILATSSSYYAIFFLVLLAFTGLSVLVRDRAWRPFWAAATAGVVTVLVMLANMLPDLVYGWQNGANPGGLDRGHAETEGYALKLAALLLPWSDHRIGFLRAFRQQYDSSYPLASELPALGLIAAVGFIGAVIILLLLLVTRRRPWNSAPSWDLVSGLAALILVSFLFSTIGGLSTFISFATSSLRGWNRMSIVLALLSLGALGLLLDKALARWFTRHEWRPAARRVTVGMLCVGLLGVAFVDQTPSDASATYAATEKQFAADHLWFSAVEASLPEGSTVLLLPYLPFPETQAGNGFIASNQLVPYLQTTNLRWSNGGIKGRPTADWPGQLSNYSHADLATLAATADMAGIMIQRAAFTDGGAAVETALAASTGHAARVSADGQYAFVDLQGIRADLADTKSSTTLGAAAELITIPVTAYPTPSLGSAFDEDEVSILVSRRLPASFVVANAGAQPVPVTVTFDVVSEVESGSTTVSFPGGGLQVQEYTDHTATFTLAFTAPPDTATVDIAVVDAVGGPVRSAKVVHLTVTQDALSAYLSGSTR